VLSDCGVDDVMGLACGFALSAEDCKALVLEGFRWIDKMPTGLGVKSVRRTHSRVRKAEADFASLCKSQIARGGGFSSAFLFRHAGKGKDCAATATDLA
jgi:hypothetical protein